MSIVDAELTSLSFCWRLERKDGAGMALTSHDEPLLIGGVNYDPAPGLMPAAITRSLGLEADRGEVAGALSTDTLTEADLTLGRWNDAIMQLSAVDWADTNAQPIRLLGGEIGSVSIEDDRFTADLSGAAAKLDRPICPATSPECRAALGDKRCRVDLAGRSFRAEVMAAERSELTLGPPADSRFVFGRLRFLSGKNCGVTTTILAVDGAQVILRDPPRAAIEPGCRVELREGCDKRFETCVTRFQNAANFRGEPHLPGTDLLTRYPGA